MTPPPSPAPDLATLAAMRCKAGGPRLTPAELATHLQMLAGWTEAGGVRQSDAVCAAKTDRLYVG